MTPLTAYGVDRASASEIEQQAAYHRELFSALYDWGTVWNAIVDMTGDAERALSLGFDELGHFGALGTELVADRLMSSASGPLAHVVELGSGFGGALRHMGRLLRARGIQASLTGVELVPAHRELAAEIGRIVGDTEATVITADARHVPLASASADAVFATGSASHFSGMAEVLVEAHRLLRPGGVLAMTEEVSLRPRGGPPVGEAFARDHPESVFASASPEQRRAEIEASGLVLEAFEPLRDWAVPLLRQQAAALRLLEGCSTRTFGGDESERIVATLTSAADEFERGSVEPALIVARRR